MQLPSLQMILSAAAAAALFTAAVPAGADPAAAPAGSPADEAAPLIGPPAAGGLTSDQVATRAARTSHEAQARAEESAAARAGVSQANAAYVPRLSGVARYTRLSSLEQPSLGTLVAVPPGTPSPVPPNTPLFPVALSFPVIVDQYTTQATLQVPLSDYLWRLPKLAAAAKDNARAAALLEQAARLRVATDGRVAYYGWARARLQAEVADRAVAQARLHLRDVSAANASGVASKADVLRVEAQVANAELLLTRARAAIEVLDRRLRTLMHDESGGAYQIGEDLRVVPDDARTTAALARPQKALLGEALERRPEPRALLATAEAARAQASAVRAAGLPRLDGVANAAYARPNGRIFPQKDEFRSTWDASLQLSFAPTDLFGTEAGRSGALARARQIDEERAALGDGIELEIAQAVASLREAAAALHTTARGLAAAEESYRVRRTLFQNGRATSVELTDAENEFSRAQLEAIGARIDHHIATARLTHALGEDVQAEKS